MLQMNVEPIVCQEVVFLLQVRMPYHLEYVRNMIVKKNFFVIQSQVVNLSRQRAEEFYAEHKGKFFYNR